MFSKIQGKQKTLCKDFDNLYACGGIRGVVLNIATGTLYSNTTYAIDNDILNCRDGIKIDDIDEVRSDFYQCVDNTAMFWKIQSINCFQSSVSTSIMQFYDAMGITRDVALKT